MPAPAEEFCHNCILDLVVNGEGVLTVFVPYLEIRQGHTMLRVVSFAKEQVPQAELLCLHFELFNDRDDRLPTFDRVRRELSMCQLASRENLLL
jgi:hypothetical protein